MKLEWILANVDYRESSVYLATDLGLSEIQEKILLILESLQIDEDIENLRLEADNQVLLGLYIRIYSIINL